MNAENSQGPVDFMIIGAAKSGTTSLAAQLAQHDQVFFSQPKEPTFFSHAGSDWRHQLDEYHARYFADAPRHTGDGRRVLLGEGSVSYSFFPNYAHTPQRLAEYNPELRLIYMMRDPVERFRSQFAFDAARGFLRAESVERAIMERPSLVYRGLYAKQIARYLEHFPREQLLLLTFEDYRADPLATLSEAARFLGLASDDLSYIDLSPKNVTRTRGYISPIGRRLEKHPLVLKAGPVIPQAVRTLVRRATTRRAAAKPELTAEQRGVLETLFAADVREVGEMLGRDLWWLRERPAAAE